MKIDGKQIAQEVKDRVKLEVSEAYGKINFLIIQVGNNKASETYVRNKIKACEYVGVDYFLYHPEHSTTEELVDYICLNQAMYDGVMVQLPLPDGIDEKMVLNTIDPIKDVDGLTDENVMKLATGQEGLFPCTALGVIEILKRSYGKLEGATISIVGRSNLVGKPLIQLLLRENASVCVFHSKSDRDAMRRIINSSDIVISAIGKAKYFDVSWFSNHQVVIDVGINRDDDGKLCGDVDTEQFDDLLPNTLYTPVPGGVGPLTVAMLMNNILCAYKINQQRIEEVI